MMTKSELISGFEKCEPMESQENRNMLIIIDNILCVLGAVIILIRALIALSSNLFFIAEKSTQLKTG